MKIALVVVALFTATAIVVLLIGVRLPPRHRVSREIILRRPPNDVYGAVRDFAVAPSWRPDVQRVEMLELAEGRVRFREHGKNGSITYEIVQDAPGAKLVTRIVDRDLGYFGSWTYEFAPAENGMTVLRITEEGEVPNIFFRFMSRFVFGHASTMNVYLKALRRKFGEEITPNDPMR